MQLALQSGTLTAAQSSTDPNEILETDIVFVVGPMSSVRRVHRHRAREHSDSSRDTDIVHRRDGAFSGRIARNQADQA